MHLTTAMRNIELLADLRTQLVLPTATTDTPLPVAPPPRAVVALKPFDPENPGDEIYGRLSFEHRSLLWSRMETVLPYTRTMGLARVTWDIDLMRTLGVGAMEETLAKQLGQDFPGLDLRSINFSVRRGPSGEELTLQDGQRTFRSNNIEVIYRLNLYVACRTLHATQVREGTTVPVGAVEGIVNRGRLVLHELTRDSARLYPP